MTEVLRREIAIRCTPQRAFEVFTQHIDLWWPRGHRKWPEGKLRFDGTAIVDAAPDGTAWTMATVRAIEPGERLVLDWFPGSPQAPTEVAISFAADEAGTRVTIVHQATTAAAEAIWPQRVALFARGWDAVLAALGDTISSEDE